MKGAKKLLPLIGFLLAAGVFPAHSDGPILLTVVVRGAEPNQGQILLSLFTSEETFLKSPLLKKQAPVDERGQAEFHLDNLEPGSYALSAVYDADMSGELNRGLFGIPTEPVGVSNNAKGFFGPPSYSAAKFSLSESRTLQISLTDVKD